MAITDWPEAERPRERLLAQGARALSDAELLAVFLRVGIKGKSAVDLARDCIQRFGSLGRLFNAARADFSAIPGMGDAKYAQLQAVLEMARRTIESELRQDTAGLTSPQAVRDLLRLKLAALEYEVFMVLFLDTQNRLLATEELFRGTIAQTAVYPREVVKRALAWNASAVVLAHNHPSGLAEPSGADHSITRTLRDALALVDVRTLDHFIVAGHQAISFAERGWL